jgi:hypothetical protein
VKKRRQHKQKFSMWQMAGVVGIVLGVMLAMAGGSRSGNPTDNLRFEVVGLGVGLLSVYLLARTSPKREQIPLQCRKCGYDLTANVSGVCPECGTRLDDHWNSSKLT